MYHAVIIGAGNIAAGFDSPDSPDILTHAHAYQCNPAFRLMGFYDKDRRKAKEAADKWGVQAYETLSAAMETAEVVSCCVPDVFHRPVLEEISAYQPNLVIAEKPLAPSLEEGEILRRVYGEEIPFLLNYSRRFLPEFQKLREEIKQYGKFTRGVGYYGKGIVHNGSHMIDFLRYLFGTVECRKVLPSAIEDFEGDSSKEAILGIREGQFHMLAIDSRIVTVFELDLFFEKARIRILEGGILIEKYKVSESDTYEGYYNYVLAECKEVDYSRAMTGLLENAERLLNGEEKPACSLEDGLDVLKICMQIRGE